MDKNFLIKEYVNSKKSIPDIAKETGKGKSTVRYWLKKYKLLRSRKEGHLLAKHKMGKHLAGKKRVFTDQHKENMRLAAIKRWSGKSKGISLKPNGYYEITTGKNKGRSLHSVIMEIHIGRKLKKDEIVHHVNGVKTDNRIENLEIMTRSEHAKHHAMESLKNRERDDLGKFV